MSTSHNSFGRWFFLTVEVMLLFSSTTTSASLLFQCQSSSDQSGLVYTPNIPDFHFNHEDVAINYSTSDVIATTVNNTYIFTIPESHDCNGSVRSIQYCYRALISDIGKEIINLFRFAVLSHNGTQFRVNKNNISISTTPKYNICTNHTNETDVIICCDNMSLSLSVPSGSIMFGILISNNTYTPLLGFNDTIMEYNSEQYRANLEGPPSSYIAQVQNITDSNKVNGSLLLLRFMIDPIRPTSTSTSDPTLAPSTDQSLLSGAIIGGVLLFSAAHFIIIVLLVLWVKRRSKIYKTLYNAKVIENNEADSGHVIGGNMRYRSYEYAGSGPQVFIEVKHHETLQASLENSGYAYIESEEEIEYSYTRDNIDAPHYECDEEIYIAPAKDERSLYTQLRCIRIEHLHRKSIRLQGKIGSGQFGVVCKGIKELQSGGGEVNVAVKTLKEGSGEEDRIKFLQEAAIMGQFKHHNVVTMFGVVTEGEPILLVLELLTKGDLRSHLLHMRSDKVSVDEHTLLSYCRQVASGMAYLSSKAFVHRDLAARNILVSEDEICKIADFGMSRDLMDESYYVSHGGMIPVKWTAPEALHYKKYSTASDVWSYGALMYEIWSVGHKPYEGHENKEVISLIDSGFRLPPPPGCPRALYTIMMSCWHPEATARPVFTDITQQLSLPDTRLLKWSEEDKSVHPEAAKLGTDLLCAQDLYKDLQNRYTMNQ